MRYTWIIIGVLITFPTRAQKIVEKVWDKEGLDMVVIESDVCYEINVSTADNDIIKVGMETEGEYTEKFALIGVVESNHLYISTELNPYFKVPNDKLAAHKVNSVRLRVILPIGIKAAVNSESAHFKGTGTFVQLEVNQVNGNCFIAEFSGNARLTSKYGSVEVHCREALVARATSSFGQVYNEFDNQGSPKLIIESVKGDIRVQKSQE